MEHGGSATGEGEGGSANLAEGQKNTEVMGTQSVGNNPPPRAKKIFLRVLINMTTTTPTSQTRRTRRSRFRRPKRLLNKVGESATKPMKAYESRGKSCWLASSQQKGVLRLWPQGLPESSGAAPRSRSGRPLAGGATALHSHM